MEVVSVGTGSSYLFVCGQWLSLEKGCSVVEKDYESGKVRVGAILQKSDPSQTQSSIKNVFVFLERADATDSDIRISCLVEKPEIRHAPILYRSEFCTIVVSAVLFTKPL